MYLNQNFVAIIPARKGSRGLKNKNILNLNGHPLISYSINFAKKSKFIDKVFVTTDGLNIAKISKRYGANVIIRPKNLANEMIMPDFAVVHAIKYIENKLNYKIDNVVFLQPTCPLRKNFEIDKAIKFFYKTKADSLFSGVDIQPHIWSKTRKKLKPINFNPKKRLGRQNSSQFVNETGSFYITKKDIFKKFNNRFGGKIVVFLSDIYTLFDIDSIKEFNFVSKLLKANALKSYGISIPSKKN